MTFNDGIPDFSRPIVTEYGLCTMRRFREDGTVDLYVGNGRTFTVPGATAWREAGSHKP